MAEKRSAFYEEQNEFEYEPITLFRIDEEMMVSTY